MASPDNEAQYTFVNQESQSSRIRRGNEFEVNTVSVATIVLSLVPVVWGVISVLIGRQYQNNCSYNSWIPIWLIVFGALMILFVFGLLKLFARNSTMKKAFYGVASVVSILHIVALIIGSILVYPGFNKATQSCNHTLYWYSFWSITVFWVIYILACIFGGFKAITGRQ